MTSALMYSKSPGSAPLTWLNTSLSRRVITPVCCPLSLRRMSRAVITRSSPDESRSMMVTSRTASPNSAPVTIALSSNCFTLSGSSSRPGFR